MTREQFTNILKYCYNLSMLVSTSDAERYGLVDYDQSICDFLRDFATAYENNNEEEFDIENDEFYSEVYSTIQAGINNIYK